jgi:hypothetical protein
MGSRVRLLAALGLLLLLLPGLAGCAAFPKSGSGGLLARSPLFRDDGSGLPPWYSDTSKDISRNLNR